MTNVLQHFNEAFPGLKVRAGDDADALVVVTVDSIRGRKCKAVIDATKTLCNACDAVEGITAKSTKYLHARRDDALRFCLLTIGG